jgi:hypothetical protein
MELLRVLSRWPFRTVQFDDITLVVAQAESA